VQIQVSPGDEARLNGDLLVKAFADKWVLARVVHNSGAGGTIGVSVDVGHAFYMRGPTERALVFVNVLSKMDRVCHFDGENASKVFVDLLESHLEEADWFRCSSAQVMYDDNEWAAMRDHLKSSPTATDYERLHPEGP
jgi:hypothetical protein